MDSQIAEDGTPRRGSSVHVNMATVACQAFPLPVPNANENVPAGFSFHHAVLRHPDVKARPCASEGEALLRLRIVLNALQHISAGFFFEERQGLP